MTCIQCRRCHSSEVVPSRWRFNATDLWTAATLRRPFRCTACLHRFGGWAASAVKSKNRQAKWRRPVAIIQTGALALALSCMFLAGAPARADVVYTTASVAENSSSSNVTTPSTSAAYHIGDFGTSTTPVFNFTKSNGKQLAPGVQFTTSTFNDTQTLTGININLFVAGGSGGANSINSGTMRWDLYQSSTKVGSFTSALNALAWNSSTGPGANVYQNNPLNLVAGGSASLMSNTQYTLLLSAIDGLTAVNSPNNAQLYWSYYATTPATGQPYTLNNSGYVAGAYTGANPFTQQNLAFDINTQSAPEPGTLLLGLIASSAGGGMVWWKRRKKSQAPPTDGPEEPTPV